MTKKQDEDITIKDDGNDVVPRVSVKDDPVDHFSVSGEDDFPGQEMVYTDKIDEMSDKGESLGHGKRKIKPRPLFSPKMKCKTHRSKTTIGAGFPQIKRIGVERKKEEILNQ